MKSRTGHTIKMGDIILLNGTVQKKVLVISEPEHSYGKFPYKFMMIHMSDLERLKAGDRKARRIYTSQAQDGLYTFVGPGQKKDVLLANLVHKELAQSHNDYAEKNHSLITYDSTARGYAVSMADGNKAHMGDTVIVRFKNGGFEGTISKVAGNRDGEVMIMFRERSKNMGIKPERILRKKK